MGSWCRRCRVYLQDPLGAFSLHFFHLFQLYSRRYPQLASIFHHWSDYCFVHSYLKGDAMSLRQKKVHPLPHLRFRFLNHIVEMGVPRPVIFQPHTQTVAYAYLPRSSLTKSCRPQTAARTATLLV